jgi:integrase
VARPAWEEQNGKPHLVQLSDQSIAVLRRMEKRGPYVFADHGAKPLQNFAVAKRKLDELSKVTGWRLHDLRRTCVSGMARLGIAPHVADKILNHQSGTIAGIAAVYQRHEFLSERKETLDRWGKHLANLLAKAAREPGRLRPPIPFTSDKVKVALNGTP